MKELILTTELVENYYNNHFQNDLRLTADHFVCNYNIVNPSFFLFSLNVENNDRNLRCNRFEDEFLYLSFMTFAFAAESSLYRIMGGDIEGFERFMEEFGFTLLPIGKKSIRSYIFDRNIHLQNEAEILCKALGIVKPFMKTKLENFISNRAPEEPVVSIYLLNKYIDDEIGEALFNLRRRFFNYKGLVGVDVSGSKIKKYLDHCFFNHFKRYFPVATDEGAI